ELLAYVTRVSAPQNQENPKFEGLLKTLYTNGHWSPFEMIDFTVEIITTRAISAQIIRHRSFSFQEFSQRYANINSIPDEELFEIPHLRSQDPKNRQKSVDDIDPEMKKHFEEKIKKL